MSRADPLGERLKAIAVVLRRFVNSPITRGFTLVGWAFEN